VRIAALAFGVIAGLVASLVLALGGLDAAALHGFDARQLQLLQFGLFVVANFGVLGAGVALAAPLAGAILLLIGAVVWVVAALLLRHGPDYVLITPPVLLLIAFAFALVAWLRQRRDADAYYEDEDAGRPRRAEPQRYEDDEEDEDDEPDHTQVRAGFFGQGGTASPAIVQAGRPPQPNRAPEPAMAPRPRDDEWRPGSRPPPPRQKPMFRQPDEDEDEEESGWARFARGFFAVANFGLYAALAGAAALIFWNLRTADTGRAVATIEAQPSVAAIASSSAPATAPILEPPSSAPAPTTAEVPPASTPAAPNLITAAPTLDDAPLVAPAPTQSIPGVVEQNPAGADFAAIDSANSLAASQQPPGAAQVPSVGTPAQPVPYPLVPRMAAERHKPAPRNAVTAPPETEAPPPSGDAGL
jgi:hypothetical protein